MHAPLASCTSMLKAHKGCRGGHPLFLPRSSRDVVFEHLSYSMLRNCQQPSHGVSLTMDRLWALWKASKELIHIICGAWRKSFLLRPIKVECFSYRKFEPWLRLGLEGRAKKRDRDNRIRNEGLRGQENDDGFCLNTTITASACMLIVKDHFFVGV